MTARNGVGVWLACAATSGLPRKTTRFRPSLLSAAWLKHLKDSSRRADLLFTIKGI